LAKGGGVVKNLSVGSQVKIESYKHNGTIHRIWQNNTILQVTSEQVIGVNEATLVIEREGKEWITEEPGVFYFSKKWWFNVIGLLQEDDVYYYCNLSSPFVYENKTVKYIDYDLDIIVYPDMTYHLVDVAEFHQNKKQMNYPRDLQYILDEATDQVIQLIEQREEPFSIGKTKYWYEQFLNVHQ